MVVLVPISQIGYLILELWLEDHVTTGAFARPVRFCSSLFRTSSSPRLDIISRSVGRSVSRSVSRLTAPLFSLSRRSCRLMGGSEETPEPIECALVPLSQELLVIVYTRSLHRSKP